MEKKNKKYKIIYSLNELNLWCSKIEKEGICSFTTVNDTTEEKTMKKENLMGIYFALKNKNEILYVPIKNLKEKIIFKEPIITQTDQNNILLKIKSITENAFITKIVQNLKFQLKVLSFFHITISNPYYDSILESYTLNTYTKNYENISQISNFFFEKEKVTNIEKRKKIITTNHKDFTLKEKIDNAANDVLNSFQLHEKLWPLIQNNKILVKIFNEIDKPLTKILFNIEKLGVLIDINYIKKHTKKIEKKLKILTIKARSLTHKNLNLSSSKEIKKVLYTSEYFSTNNKTSQEKKRINKKTLENLSLKSSLPEIILNYRKLNKLKTNYLDKILNMTHPITKRLHTSYYQTTTSTSRLSSRNPNLQNIPNQDYEGTHIRKAFTSPKNSLIMTADYSQIELRILAHYSKDQTLLNSFLKDEDIHAITASEIFQIPLKTITQEKRKKGKIINFGLIYGMTAYSLAQQLSITKVEAQKYINIYFKKYSFQIIEIFLKM